MAIQTPARLSTLDDFLADLLPRVEAEMSAVLDSFSAPPLFSTMLKYHLGFADAAGNATRAPSGKRLRPALLMLACEVCNGDPAAALPAAAAVELLHNFSLIHDDIEDRDGLRRGRPTVWRLWGEAQAINAGDAMFAMAHLALLRCAERGLNPAHVLAAMRTFDEMCVKLTIGQHLDLSFESRSDLTVAEYLQMITGKTAALIAASCAIGAQLAGATPDQTDALIEFGQQIGTAFQMQDDLLGIWGDPEQTGKHSTDLAHRKKTLPVLYAAERNPDLRRRYFQDRTPLSQADLAWVKAAVEEAGGRKYAESLASEAHQLALDALRRIPEHPARHLLFELSQRLIGRNR